MNPRSPWVGWLTASAVILAVGIVIIKKVEKHLFPIVIEEAETRSYHEALGEEG